MNTAAIPIANWPLTLSRDGARTPMPWQKGGANHGFTKGEPWLPFGDDHAALAVDQQEAHTGSFLNFTRALLHMRRANPALVKGSIRIKAAKDSLLVFERHSAEQSLLFACNMGADPISWSPEGDWRIVESINGAMPGTLPAFGALLLTQ
jgi:alpha-glucosidase